MTGLFESLNKGATPDAKRYVVYRRNEGQFEANQRNNVPGGGGYTPDMLSTRGGFEADIAAFNTKKEAFEFARTLASQAEIFDSMGLVFGARYSYQVKSMKTERSGRVVAVPVIADESAIEVEHETESESETDPDAPSEEFLKGVQYALTQGTKLVAPDAGTIDA